MNVIGKAFFKDYEEYVNWYNSDEGNEWYQPLWKAYFYENQDVEINKKRLGSIYNEINRNNIHNSWGKSDKTIRPLVDYIEYHQTFNIGFDVYIINEELGFSVIASNGSAEPRVIATKFLDIKLYETYEELPGDKLAALKGNSDYSLMVQSGLSKKEVKEEIALTSTNIDTLEADIERVKKEQDEELAVLRKEIEEKVKELEKIKTDKLNELRLMKEQMNIKVAGLSQKLYQLETEIYAIQCFNGDVIDFIKLKNGKASDTTEPLVIYQKLRYMDNELAKAIALKNADFNNHKLFERFLAESPMAEEIFFPDKKCVVGVRISKTGVYFGGVTTKSGVPLNMLATYEKFHGGKIGIIVRDGENLYIGWTDDERLSIKEDLFHTNKNNNESAEDMEMAIQSIERAKEEQIKAAKDKGKFIPTNEQSGIVSRYYLFSILNGFVERGIINIPEGISIMEDSEYVKFSRADNWINSDKYGTLQEIMEKYRCNKEQVGDPVVTLMGIKDTSWARDYWSRDTRSRGDGNRARGAKVKGKKLYNINFIDEYDKVYVSVPTEASYWNKTNSRANFSLESDEYVNIVFYNSLVIGSVLQSESLGGWRIGGNTVNYSYGAAYLWLMRDWLLKREEEVISIAKAEFGVDLSTITEWQILFSEWMQEKNVHNISAYQVKRFLKSQNLIK